MREDADAERAWERIHRSRAAIGTLLLNQSVIAGVGNVYRCEVLHLLKIHPETCGQALSREQFDELWLNLTALLRIGVRYNRITVPCGACMLRGRLRLTSEHHPAAMRLSGARKGRSWWRIH